MFNKLKIKQMKRNVFFTLAVAFVMLLTSCGKEVSLPGTTWKANYTNTITVEGIAADVAMDMTIKFIDETKYAMDVNVSMSAMGQTLYSDRDSDEGTYTFDGEKGVFDGEQNFTYNKDDKTIVMSFDIDGEEAQLFGTNKITLNFKEQ